MEVKADVDLLPNAGCRCVQRSPVVVQMKHIEILAMLMEKWESEWQRECDWVWDHLVESFICGAIVALYLRWNSRFNAVFNLTICSAKY